MIQLPVPTRSNTSIDIVLDGNTYTFKYTYNTRNRRLYLSILSNEVVIISGLRIVENATPLSIYPLEGFTGGQLYVFKSKETENPVTLGNIGIDNSYWLVYIPATEWAV